MRLSPKYNRTFHFPFSKGATNDDKICKNLSKLIGNEIVITEKIDGSNTSLERKGCFARTHSGPPSHSSFDGLKALHASIKDKLNDNIQLFGEWTYAVHSITYSELPHYFLMFNVRYLDKEKWASWDEVEMWAEEINVPTTPILFRGKISNEKELQLTIEKFMSLPSKCGGMREGVVARVASEFLDADFSSSVIKCVRANHVQNKDIHWRTAPIVKNELK